VGANESLQPISLQGQEKVESNEVVKRAGLTAEDVFKLRKTPAIAENVGLNESLHDVRLQGQERVKPEEKVDRVGLAAEDLFNPQSSINHRLNEFVPGQMYRSSQVMRNGKIFMVGFGNVGENHYRSTNGRVHDMSKPLPRLCFYCGGLHWRRDCPYAAGNGTLRLV